MTRQFGYHLALGGGVLNTGESKKDLDLYFLPMGGFDNKKQHNPDKMLKALEAIWGPGESIQKSGYGYNKATMSFYSHAVIFTRLGGIKQDIKQRIDCFIF